MSLEKICLTYFKICALYFEIGRTYFREGKNGAKIMRNKKAFLDMNFNISFLGQKTIPSHHMQNARSRAKGLPPWHEARGHDSCV